MINFGDYEEFKNSNENVIGEGTHCIVWSDSPEYVYKVDKSIRKSLDEQRELMEKKNRTGVIAPLELIGYMTSERGYHPVYKQKRYRTLEDLVIDWMKDKGWKKVEKWGYVKGNQFLCDVRPCNIALDENFNPIIIDMNLYDK